MAKNLPAVAGKKKQFKEITDIVATPGSRAKLQNYIDEVLRCKTRILDEQESIKGLRDAAVEELSIQPKLFNSIVSLYFNNSFEQKKEEIGALEAAIDALMGNISSEDGDDE